MKKEITIFLILLIACIAKASSEAHDGVPTKTIIFQILNLSVLIGIIVYFTKDSIKKIFAEKKNNYLQSAQKSKEARAEAEKQYNETRLKIEELEKNKKKTMEAAKVQGESILQQMSEDASAVTKRMKEEVELTIKLDVEKANLIIKKDIIAIAIASAKDQLSKDMNATDQQNLQKQFVEKIPVAK